MARPGQIRSGPVRTLQAAAASGRDMGRQTAARTRFYATVIDEVFMGGGSAQERLAAAQSGVPVVWVGVRCDPDVAEARGRARPDRVPGMARLQAGRVHEGVVYDLVVGSDRDLSGWPSPSYQRKLGERMMFTPVGCGGRAF